MFKYVKNTIFRDNVIEKVTGIIITAAFGAIVLYLANDIIGRLSH